MRLYRSMRLHMRSNDDSKQMSTETRALLVALTLSRVFIRKIRKYSWNEFFFRRRKPIDISCRMPLTALTINANVTIIYDRVLVFISFTETVTLTCVVFDYIRYIVNTLCHTYDVLSSYNFHFCKTFLFCKIIVFPPCWLFKLTHPTQSVLLPRAPWY